MGHDAVGSMVSPPSVLQVTRSGPRARPIGLFLLVVTLVAGYGGVAAGGAPPAVSVTHTYTDEELVRVEQTRIRYQLPMQGPLLPPKDACVVISTNTNVEEEQLPLSAGLVYSSPSKYLYVMTVHGRPIVVLWPTGSLVYDIQSEKYLLGPHAEPQPRFLISESSIAALPTGNDSRLKKQVEYDLLSLLKWKGVGSFSRIGNNTRFTLVSTGLSAESIRVACLQIDWGTLLPIAGAHLYVSHGEKYSSTSLSMSLAPAAQTFGSLDLSEKSLGRLGVAFEKKQFDFFKVEIPSSDLRGEVLAKLLAAPAPAKLQAYLTPMWSPTATLRQEPARVATYSGNVEALVGALGDRPNPDDSRNSSGQSLLHVAAALGHAQLIKPLLAKGFELEVRDNYGRTPLFMAAACANEEALKALLSEGARVDARANDGSTALDEAQLTGRPSVVEMLIKAGADVNAHDKKGQTPLMHAAFANWGEAVSVMLRHKADGSLRDDLGVTALHHAVAQKSFDSLKSLIEGGIPVDITDAAGRTGLHYAVAAGDAVAVSLLLGKGARIDTRDKKGITPLDAAVQLGKTDLVKLLNEFSPH